jgi:hypothetical protein
MRAQKLWKKARRAGLAAPAGPTAKTRRNRRSVAALLFELSALCQERGWSAEELLRVEAQRREWAWRRLERSAKPRPAH